MATSTHLKKRVLLNFDDLKVFSGLSDVANSISFLIFKGYLAPHYIVYAVFVCRSDILSTPLSRVRSHSTIMGRVPP